MHSKALSDLPYRSTANIAKKTDLQADYAPSAIDIQLFVKDVFWHVIASIAFHINCATPF